MLCFEGVWSGVHKPLHSTRTICALPICKHFKSTDGHDLRSAK